MKTETQSFVILLLSISLCACAVSPDPACEKDGNVYCKSGERFTGQWYDYYKRAISCMEGECYSEAIIELDEAIRRRPGEKRWANTYGMRFMNYFPHRERGIAKYFLGDDDAATWELETSLEQEPSEKAFFYLDRVRVRIMRREKQKIGRPYIEIQHPRSKFGEIYTKSDPVIISGVAEDEQYVSAITLSGKPVFMEASSQHAEFEEELSLDQGRHEISISAYNLLGGETRQRLILHVDRSGPLVITEKFHADRQIQGYVSDPSGICALVADLDGKQENVPLEPDGSFAISLKPGMKDIVLLAADELGNETKAMLKPDMTAKTPSPLLFAQNAIISSDRPAFPASENSSEIIVRGWPDQDTVFSKNADIEGQARGISMIEELTLNQKQLIKKPGQIISFHQSVKLDPGKNIVSIRARDASGHTSARTIVIIRKIPKVFRPEYRYALRMCAFDNIGENRDSGIFGHLFSEFPSFWIGHHFMGRKKRALFQHLLAERLRNRNRFQISAHEQLRAILREHELCMEVLESGAGTSDRSEASDSFVCTGTCHSLLLGDTCESGKGTEIIARLTDIRSGEILAVKDVYSESEKRSSLMAMAERLAEKFHRAFPLTESLVTGVSGKRIRAAFEHGNIAERWPVIIYREQVSSDTEIIADAVVGKDKAIFAKDRIAAIRVGDRVIAR